MNLLQY